MKKQHIILIAVAAISIVLGAVIAVTAALMASPGSAQSEVETQAETQVEHEPEAETQIEHQTEAEVEEVSSTEPTDADFVKTMPEQDQAYLIAIICLATEDGHSPSEVAETIAENFDEISEDYAQRFVSASLITVCSQTAE